MRWFCRMLLSVFCVLLVRGAALPAEPLSEQAQPCFGCHGNKDFSADLRTGGKMPLYVNAESFSASVHARFACAGCHSGISLDSHPSGKLPRSRRDYASSASGVCKTCHAKFKTGIHGRLADFSRNDLKLCVDCHNPHAVMPVSQAGPKSAQYCLSCHSNRLSMRFRDGTSHSVQIDPAELNQSVHRKISCSDCHFGFSAEDHPVRNFRSGREYSIAASESCRRCHFDKYTKTLESIHYAMLSKGILDAPVCVDCHGAHAILPAAKQRAANAKRCEKCHGEIYRIYSTSVHGKALFSDNNQDVPVCSDCHLAHNIADPRTLDYREHVPQICGNCHANKQLMAKYGLSTAVLNSYLQDFHGVTLKLYKKQRELGDQSTLKPIAVCIDCHGIHDITATTGPGSSIVKANLVKRCRKCHAGASENFPASWISHYEPSLTKAPIVFAINLIYRIFIPFMMVGLILQILLHIWRYAVNR